MPTPVELILTLSVEFVTKFNEALVGLLIPSPVSSVKPKLGVDTAPPAVFI